MKIGDFPLVETLVDSRAKLMSLQAQGRISIEIDGGRMGADFVKSVEPSIKLELRHRVLEIDQQLRQLGVEVA